MEAPTILLIAIVVFSCILLITLLGIVWHSGLFASIEIGAGKPPVGSLVTVYKFGRGPYSNTGAVFTEAVSIAPDKRSFGIYYDDPKQVPADKLRWAVGCILAEGKELPDFQLIGEFIDNGYKPFHTPAVSNAVKTTFPYTTPLSIFIAIFRVYPALGQYIKDKKLCAHPFLEVYSGFEIQFWAPLAKQDEFYVSEALKEDEEDPNDDDVSQADKEEDESVYEGNTTVGDTTTDVSVAPDVNISKGQGDCVVVKSQASSSKLSPPPTINVSEAGDCVPTVIKEVSQQPEQDSLGLLTDRKDRSRSTSAVSFKTAKDVQLSFTSSNEQQQQPCEPDIMTKSESATDSIQDSGVSSTSSQSPPKHSTPSPDLNKSTDIADNSSFLDSSSGLDSSAATSMDSLSSYTVSSVNSSFTSQSSYTEVSSYTTDGSLTEVSVDYSTEKSKDLLDMSSDSECETTEETTSKVAEEKKE